MAVNVFHAEGFEVVDGGAEADGAGDVGSSGLEAHGQVVPGGAIEGHFLNHIAAGKEGFHLLQNVRLDVEAAYSGGA